ncbi:imidazole glycerol phosphate synthase subunit HisF [Candidatus Methylacidithermus pantelleriae]|nr:imidazole glycerol phosphate synthase subunit HisF [Candidatus Methylacidithermus pantelleriae]
MLAKRIIACLDVHAGQVTRGKQFGKAEAGELEFLGDPVELARRYDQQGVDEIVFYDITASSEGRRPFFDILARTADVCFVPLTAGGGVRSLADIRDLLLAGADKVSMNTMALQSPGLIREAASVFGSQCIVVSMDVRRTADGHWQVYSHGGRRETCWEALAWAKEAVELGAGEIVLNSIDSDGMSSGYSLEIVRLVSDSVPVPVVASGGAGKPQDFLDVFQVGRADAALAAGIFHRGVYTVGEIKAFLRGHGILVR